jgi:hypothetical protein
MDHRNEFAEALNLFSDYCLEHGQAAGRELLQRLAGADRVIDVPEEKIGTVIRALKPKPKSFDSLAATAFAKWNAAAKRGGS